MILHFAKAARAPRHRERIRQECRRWSIRYNTALLPKTTFIQFTMVCESLQWFSLEGQFSTTDIGRIADFNWVLTRNFCPSWLTS